MRAQAFTCPTCGQGSYPNPRTKCDRGCLPHLSFQTPKADQSQLASKAKQAASLICKELQTAYGTSAYTEATGHGASSKKIQELITPTLNAKGFKNEISDKVGLAGFRADFQLLSENDGILVEVERGKTLDNNMDMIDFWKCHVHPKAHHLILVVPIWYTTKRGTTATFPKVCSRMKPMFQPGNYTNVWSLHIVGY